MTTLSRTNSSRHRLSKEVNALVDEIEEVYMLDRPRRCDDDRREMERMSVTIPLVVTPLDDRLRPLAYHHQAITRDISRKGVGLVTTSPVRPSFVLLTFEPCRGRSMSVMGRVVYCKEVGYYFQVGCEFLLS
jgi:hypothetical protein